MDMEMLSGVFAPMVTPFGGDDAVLTQGLIGNVERMNSTDLRGYFVLGTNGEFKSLSTEERFAVLEAILRHRARNKVVMAGCGAESTKETIDLVERAAGLGADMASILMPSFFPKRMTVDVMERHSVAIADTSPIPIVLYNNPSVAAGVTIRRELLQRVAGHPRIVGIKDSSKETYRENLQVASPSFRVLAGSAGYFLDLLKNGGTGGVLSLANVFPEACARLYRAYCDGRLAEAEALDRQLVELNHKVSGTFGVAGVKAAMTLAGYTGGVMRRPHKALTADEVGSFRSELECFIRQ